MLLTDSLTTTRPPSTASAWATRTSRSSTPCSTRNASRSLWRTRSSEPHLTCYEAACLESTIVPDNCFVFEDGVEKGLFGNFRLSRLLRSIVGFRLLRAELRLSVRRSVLRPRTPHRPRMGCRVLEPRSRSTMPWTPTGTALFLVFNKLSCTYTRYVGCRALVVYAANLFSVQFRK